MEPFFELTPAYFKEIQEYLARLARHKRHSRLHLIIHSKALHDSGYLRLKQVPSREFNATSPRDSSPPPEPNTCLREMLSLANGPQTLKEFDTTNLRKTLMRALPLPKQQQRTVPRFCSTLPAPQGLTWRPLPIPWRVNSETEFDNETNQDSKPPMFILTAVTRNLAFARFLCEYSGPFSGLFSKIQLDI